MSPASGRARCLLALLAWQPNTFVSDEALIDGIWGESIPDHPRDSLYTCALRLRKALREVSPDGWVIRRRGGYILGTDSQSVDLHLFRDLVRRARDAIRTGDVRPAGELFERAMGLWSGMPLADVDSAWATRARTMLQGEWFATRVSAAEVAIREERHAELVAPLTVMTEQHPLDERVAGLLMLALYRCGRQAEALAHYTWVRELLVRELGNEPGRALRDLHARLLRGDPPPSLLLTS